MGKKCSVENCTSDSIKPEHTGVTFHKVPLHNDIRPKWLSLCRIPEDKSHIRLLYVCSRHFLRADFCNFRGKKYMLKQGVLPSVFPWDKSKLEAIKAVATIKKDGDSPKKKEKVKGTKRKEDKSLELAHVNAVNIAVQDIAGETEIKIEPVEIKTESEDIIKQDISEESATKPVKLELKAEVKNELLPVKADIDAFDQHQRSQNTSPANGSINFTINSHIEVLDNNNIWHVAKINEVDYEESEVLIHFEKSSNKYDEWISMTSPRLRPVPPKSCENFEVGERCMATWSDTRKFPATVRKKLENDSYEVLFDDEFIKVVKTQKMTKMNVAKPPQSSPLFEPVKGTKQERRDKKRKLNVAALFPKRPRIHNAEEKKNKASPIPVVQSAEEAALSPVSQDESVTASSPIPRWHPSWENGKPVGLESTIEGVDGLRKSIIVPDPRLPIGWAKHLTQRIYGNSIGKWDTVILAPDGKKFRSKQEVKNYLDLHPGVEVTLDMFDFSLYRGGHKRKPSKPKQKAPIEPQPVETQIEVPPVEEPQIKEEAPAPEEPPISLKIIFDNDAYKCPIEGCGKNFRRENLALMHVKHYHSEYTKYLDSTPNVADLAYARTVGENLDRSPGPSKSNAAKTVTEKPPVAQKTPKVPVNTHLEPIDDSSPAPETKAKDSEIIKLLNQKPADINSDIHPLPSGLPSNMYPDINLKDLLGKTDDIAMRDDVHIKNLCSSRPSQGIKTLLPVRQSNQAPAPTDSNEEKAGLKRKRKNSDAAETLKGKTTNLPASASTLESQQLPHQPPPLPSQHPLQQATPTNSQHQLSTNTGSLVASPIPSAFDLAPPPAGLENTQAPTVTQFDGVIIEGGKIIKLERMKQEEIINCTCGFTEEDGLMIQCELCLCWQHAYCNNIQKESEVPEKYVCYICQHPLRERQSAKYLHDQDWLKLGVLPVASYHTKDKLELEKRFEKLKKSHDLSGGLLELREYMHTLALKLKIAEAKNHPKLYLWSKPWEKPKLPEKLEIKEESRDIKPKLEGTDHQYIKNEMEIDKPNDSMLMMMLKSGKEEIPMLNMHSNMAPIIPRPEAPIDSDDCRLNLLDHIAHAESLVEERLDDFEKQMDALEECMNLETDEDYPKTRQTLQLLMRDLDTLKRFSELPMI